MGRVIHWELCRKFEFDYANKWYMQNSVSVLENETHKFLWHFQIQSDHLISARRSDLIIIKKKKKKKKKKRKKEKKSTCSIVGFAVLADHRVKLKESEKKDKYLYLAWESKKPWNMKVTVIPVVIGALGAVTKGLVKNLED